MILNLAASQAYQRALEVARDQGWRIVDENVTEGRIEATDRTRWFGVREDIVIRMTPVEGRTIVDVRSKSRVGSGDGGSNARRVRDYLAALRG